MQRKNISLMMVVVGVLLLIVTGIWLGSAQPVSAQCGSSASSCKNCHEVQGQLPVNKDGTGWHQSHAFGDFCYICHAGNNQAMDKAEAHNGLVPPLSDIQASCQQCHPNDLQARAQVYATTLGITIGDVSTSTSSGSTGSGEVTTNAPATGGETVLSPAMELNYDDPNLVDFSRRYDEIVLGKHPVNWGNVILIAMIAMLFVGGGFFVLINEKMVKFSFGDTKPVAGEYPVDVVDMLPAISKLKPRERESIQQILNDPKKTKKMIGMIEEYILDKKGKE